MKAPAPVGEGHVSEKTVLLVEDNEDNRIVYATVLQYFGFHVIEATDGAEGVRLARERRPDLVLMDISIPVIDGWHATSMIKDDPQTHAIPVIALTAHALPEDRARSVSVGCDGYLAKPCEPSRVVAEVNRVLGTRAEVG